LGIITRENPVIPVLIWIPSGTPNAIKVAESVDVAESGTQKVELHESSLREAQDNVVYGVNSYLNGCCKGATEGRRPFPLHGPRE